MKKNFNHIIKDYSKCSEEKLDYYGILIKNSRVRVDTKRFKKFIDLPDNKIEKRKLAYYKPSKIHRSDYIINIFADELSFLKELWHKEFSKAIQVIKTPKQVEENARLEYLSTGIYDYDEVQEKSLIAKIMRDKPYKFVIKSIYAQFFHQMMSQIDALCLRICVKKGYAEKDFSKKSFDVFIQGKQGDNAKSFLDFKNYHYFDRAYLVWNFLKHNSLRSYEELKRKYPEMIYDPDNNYKNGNLAITCLKIDEKFILYCLDNMIEFFKEVCELGFKENVIDSNWDYDDYFVDIIKKSLISDDLF